MIHGRYLLAYCYEQARRFDDALSQWEKIQAKKPNLPRRTGQIGRKYQDLRTDDHMKDYLTASDDQFFEICKIMVESMGFSVQEGKAVDSGCEIIGNETPSKMRNTQKNCRPFSDFCD